MRIVDDDRVELVAEFAVEALGSALTLVLKSAGGKTGLGHSRNRDYLPALRLLLERLCRLRGVIADGYVDSEEMSSRPIPERRLDLRDRSYPVSLDGDTDVESLRLELTSAQGRVGLRPSGKDGNNTKRIRLVLDVPGFGASDAIRLGKALASPDVAGRNELAGEVRRSSLDLDGPAAPQYDAVFQVIPVEAVHTAETAYERSARRIVVRRSEGALVQAYLRSLGAVDQVSRSRSTAGITDVVAARTDGVEIVEAKSTSRHLHVRLALGQLLDYAAATPQPVLRLTALLPGRPALVDVGLLHRYGVDCVYQSVRHFVRLQAPSDCRERMAVVWNGEVPRRSGAI